MALHFRVFDFLLAAVFFIPYVVSADDMGHEEAEEYFVKYQYMGPNCPHQGLQEMYESNRPMAYNMAVRMFQEHWQLPVTGEMDDATSSLMHMPRCGCADMMTMEDMPGGIMENMTSSSASYSARKRRYALFGGKWPTNDIVYKIINYPRDYDLSRSEVDEEVERAFMVWAAVSPLTFTQVFSGQAHINIRFESGNHGDGSSFDGRGRTLAHAFAPQSGDTHFDEAEEWTIGTFDGTNFFQVAAHEFGHSLGLGHSNIDSALMAPFYRGYQPEFQLHSDDIAGIQARYGRPARPTIPSTARPTQPTTRPTTTTSRPTRPVTDQAPTNPPQVPSGPAICRDFAFDAITMNSENGQEVVYGFKGNEYFKLKTHEAGIEPGYPRLISSKWDSAPTYLDAALYTAQVISYRLRWDPARRRWVRVPVVTEDAKLYFFQGGYVWLYVNDELQYGYPRAVASEFPGLPRAGGINAAFIWNGNGHIYFTIGSQYYKFDKSSGRVPAGYPQPLSNWAGLPSSLDAGIRFTNSWTYVFKGSYYYRLSDSQMEVARGYPRSNDVYWLNCDEFIR